MKFDNVSYALLCFNGLIPLSTRTRPSPTGDENVRDQIEFARSHALSLNMIDSSRYPRLMSVNGTFVGGP